MKQRRRRIQLIPRRQPSNCDCILCSGWNFHLYTMCKFGHSRVCHAPAAVVVACNRSTLTPVISNVMRLAQRGMPVPRPGRRGASYAVSLAPSPGARVGELHHPPRDGFSSVQYRSDHSGRKQNRPFFHLTCPHPFSHLMFAIVCCDTPNRSAIDRCVHLTDNNLRIERTSTSHSLDAPFCSPSLRLRNARTAALAAFLHVLRLSPER